jgi:hypothetical protein
MSRQRHALPLTQAPRSGGARGGLEAYDCDNLFNSEAASCKCLASYISCSISIEDRNTFRNAACVCAGFGCLSDPRRLAQARMDFGEADSNGFIDDRAIHAVSPIVYGRQ